MSLIVSVRGGRAEVRRSEDNLPYLICEGESQEFALDASFRACAKIHRKAAMDVTKSHDPKAPEGTDLYAEAEAEPKAKAKKEKEEPDVELPAA